MSYLAHRPSLFSRRDVVLVAGVHLALGAALLTGLQVERVFRPPVPKAITLEKIVPPPVVRTPPPPPPIVDARINPDTRAPVIDIAPPPLTRQSEAPPLANDGPAQPQLTPPGTGTADPGPTITLPPPTLPVRTAARALGRNRIDDSDYPADARRAEQEGAVQVRYTIGADGRARDCAVVQSSGHASLDRATCAKIEARFRFTPAREGDRVVEEVRAQTVRWVLTNPNS